MSDHHLKVLIADDEWLEVATLCHLLEQDPRVKVVGTASHGQEAVQMARQTRFDLVLMDIQMPGMGGIEAIRTIRQEMPQLQVIIVTAHGEFEYARQAIEHGALSYLLKPVRREELDSSVGRVLHLLERQEVQRRSDEDDLVRNLIGGRPTLPADLVRDLEKAVQGGESARAGQICREIVAAAAGGRARTNRMAVLAELLSLVERSAALAGADQGRLDVLRSAWIDRIVMSGEGEEGGRSIKEMGAAFTQQVTDCWTSGTRRLVSRASAFVAAHYAEDISLELVAQHIGVNPSYLSRIYCKETGVSFVDDLSNRRLERARHLLLNPDLTIDHVAAQVGFRSANYFSAVFRKWFGTSPGEYRRKGT